MYSNDIPDLCRKVSLPCPAGERFRDAVTCREYYECGYDGQFLIKRLCPGRKEFDSKRGFCVVSSSFKCETPVRCPNLSWSNNLIQAENSFPTDYVVGGVLGSLALVTLSILIVACIKKWQIRKKSRRRIQLRKNLRSRRMVPVFDSSDYFHDKMAQMYERISSSHNISRPYYPPMFRPMAMRPQYVQPYRYPHPFGNFDSFGSSDPALYIPNVHSEQSDEPSIITGSFIYHSPNNLPPHFISNPNYNDPDLTYDSFKNDHFFASSSLGVMNNTLTTRQLHL
ncbi:uncharacterized protein LOC118762384 [Octopus sinensis]|uniref:Uncharacterized protein LOC118762384 n=1 Tax=Octopus sinensis TaxID=2607531 RepID=A0A7E6EMZ9_9MOLL|nr:uncharacterized protein LOC118762384 [Octopus sinensis]